MPNRFGAACQPSFVHATLSFLFGAVLFNPVGLPQSTQLSGAKQPIKTGPERGQKIPRFHAPDQNGKAQTFETVRGPKGALLIFFRSADW